MSSSPVSDREKSGLRGRVKTVADQYSTVVFDEDGRTLEWSGNSFRGHVVRTYVYEENKRLVRVFGGADDHEDEFRYDGPGKTQIRRIPARPEQNHGAYGFSVWLDAVCEGEVLGDGGTVETIYNEQDQPVKKRVLDEEGRLLFRVEYVYDGTGRLSEEKLVGESPHFPKVFRDQITAQVPIEQRADVLAQMAAQFREMAQSAGFFGSVKRTCLYNELGQISERRMSTELNHEILTFTYNQRGDIAEFTREMTGGLPDGSAQVNSTMKYRRAYEYDSFGNWTSQVETSESDGKTSTLVRTRQLAYHQ